MWCIGELTQEYRACMYELLELYARPHDPREPIICVDEKAKQLLRPARKPLPAKPDVPVREDYECERAGTCNLFVAVKSRGNRRLVQGTERRTKADFPRRFCPAAASPWLCPGRARSIWSSTTSHPFPGELRGGARGERGGKPALAHRVPLHPETCELAQYGRDRDRHPLPPVSGALR